MYELCRFDVSWFFFFFFFSSRRRHTRSKRDWSSDVCSSDLVGAGSVAGTQLAMRAGTKLVVTTGLVAMAAFYAWVAATISATLAYGIIAVQIDRKSVV